VIDDQRRTELGRNDRLPSHCEIELDSVSRRIDEAWSLCNAGREMENRPGEIGRHRL
jgi:hypothetical protein